MIELRRYTPHDAEEWDAFVASSRNGTFLFKRGYMDYHADRFKDCSWMAMCRGKLAALLPANADGRTLQSHSGLTYGGWVLPQAHLDGADLLAIFTHAAGIWKKEGFEVLDYKPVPWIYSTRPSDEDLYALFRLGAEPVETGLSAAVDLRSGVRFNQQMRRQLKKALDSGVNVGETVDIQVFMQMLAECLAERHGVRPVHSTCEMELLKNRFPAEIRFFAAYIEGKMEAGVCVYDTGPVAHAQYIASTPKGREAHLLPLLFDFLMRGPYASKRYFDFGISTEDHGLKLNEGLLRQKYSLGGTGVAYTRWKLIL